MGGQQSTRRISVNNDNTIELSQEAIDRLQSQLKQTAPPPPPSYDPPPSYESSQRRHKELGKEEEYWSRRLENLRRAHSKIDATMQLEYEKARKESEQLFKYSHDESFLGKLPPCEKEKSKVIKCYEDNPNQALVCSVIVNAFNDCVCNSRISSFAST